jgi:DNA transposition AAA+ family ATPase
VVQPRLSSDNPRPQVALYTATATVTARQMEKDLVLLRWSLRVIGEAARSVPQEVETVEGMVRPGLVDLLMVDEADRLKPLALEVLRDVYDRSPMGQILVGMPGREQRLARYPQLYWRVGFVHQYRTLDREEQQEIIEQQVRLFGEERGEERKIEQEAVAQIIRMSGGNFRQMERLLSPMKRIMESNPEVEVVSREVVEAAREQLVYGKGI